MTERAVERTLPRYWVCPECSRKFAKEGQGRWMGEAHEVGWGAQ